MCSQLISCVITAHKYCLLILVQELKQLYMSLFKKNWPHDLIHRSVNFHGFRFLKRVRNAAESDCYRYHVCSSACFFFVLIEKLHSSWMNFYDILYWGDFARNLSRRFKFCYNRTNTTPSLREDPSTVHLWLLWLLALPCLSSIVIHNKINQ